MQNRQKIALEYAIKYLHTSAISKHISDVILYGSVARGEERFKSDVDILIILHDDFLATYENKKNVRHIVSDLADPWETFEAVEKKYGKTKNDPHELAETEARVITKKRYEMADDTFYRAIKREGISVWTH